MDETTRHTLKIRTTTLKALRLLAAHTGKRQTDLVDELVQRELHRMTQAPSTKGTTHDR